MSNEQMGIVEARKQLGRLVEQAHFNGTVTVLTNNGKRAAVVPHHYAQYLASDHGDLVKAVAEFLEDWDRLDSWDEATTAVNKLRAAATAQSPTAEARPT